MSHSPTLDIFYIFIYFNSLLLSIKSGGFSQPKILEFY